MTKQQKGFTLVELMIVVAIIGILSTIAIPNYLKMIGRAKQAEAKMNLGAIYTAEISYYAENATFAGGVDSFVHMGWEPTSQLVARYAYQVDEGLLMPFYHPPVDFPTPYTTSKDSFTAQAFGNIDNDPAVDIWTLDDAKQLENVQSDLR